jgi:hypothetical protein
MGPFTAVKIRPVEGAFAEPKAQPERPTARRITPRNLKCRMRPPRKMVIVYQTTKAGQSISRAMFLAK